MAIRHIYMADDDADDYYLVSTILKEVNDAVLITWFASGKELLKGLHANADNLPDLILLDMNMPANDGIQCLQNIKKHETLNAIPIVMLSTASSPAVIKKAYECGAIKYLLKPHSIEGLRQVIKEILTIIN